MIKPFAIMLMSKAQNPMTGCMSGSMANFVTTTRGGQNIIRSKAFNPRDANTAAQQLHRTCFKLIGAEYLSFGGLADESFPERAPNQSGYNMFMAANLPEAIDKSGQIPVVDYSKLKVSGGTLLKVTVSNATIVAEGVRISYKSWVRLPSVNASDEVIVVLKKQNDELYIDSQVRGDAAESNILLNCPGIKAADVKCCYLYVRNANGSKASDSTYIALD